MIDFALRYCAVGFIFLIAFVFAWAWKIPMHESCAYLALWFVASKMWEEA